MKIVHFFYLLALIQAYSITAMEKKKQHISQFEKPTSSFQNDDDINVDTLSDKLLQFYGLTSDKHTHDYPKIKKTMSTFLLNLHRSREEDYSTLSNTLRASKFTADDIETITSLSGLFAFKVLHKSLKGAKEEYDDEKTVFANTIEAIVTTSLTFSILLSSIYITAFVNKSLHP